MEKNTEDWKPTFKGATWNLVINAALACFFFIYAFKNPDQGECYAKDGLKTAHAQIPISVPETSQAEAVYATGYVEVSYQFRRWFI